MSDFASFWEAKHNKLLDGYTDESGAYAEHFGLLAIEIANRLLAEGGLPNILTLTGVKIDSINTKTLVPLAYGGSVRWGGHTVCVANGLVYDPILESPEPWETYALKTFGEPILSKDAYWSIEAK